jgi:hypothetical protein
MKKEDIFNSLEKLLAEKKAGYPPNCNEGYVEKDGKCVPVEENSESKKNGNDKEKNGKDEEKNGDDKKKNGNPFDKKKKNENPFEKKKKKS